MQKCSRYKIVCSCSRRCKDSWKGHQPLCDAIVDMIVRESRKGLECTRKGQYFSYVNPKEHNIITKRVRYRLIVKCLVNNYFGKEVLRNTGTQVSIPLHEPVTTTFYNVEIHPMCELLELNDVQLKGSKW